MTIINATIYKSGTNTPLAGYIQVSAVDELTSGSVYYTTSPVKYPLVAGVVSMDLVPTDIAKVAYTFGVYETVVDEPDTLVVGFDAVVPFSATPINFNTLATQSGLRYDRRDASLLTLARFLTSNDSFIGFLGDYLWKNRGTWNVSTIYKRGDVVLRNGSSYQYIGTSQQAGVVPEANPLTWALLVSAGGGGGGGTALPVGSMLLYSTTASVPTGYLRCDGAAVSRTTYAVLFSTIGTTYGAGNGTTTFNIPDSPIVGDSTFIVNTGL